MRNTALEHNLAGLAISLENTYFNTKNEFFMRASKFVLISLEEFRNTPEKPVKHSLLTEEKVKEILITKRTICESTKPFYTRQEKEFFERTKSKLTQKLIIKQVEEIKSLNKTFQSFKEKDLNIQAVCDEYKGKEEELKQILLKPRKENRVKFRCKTWRISLSWASLLELQKTIENLLKVSKTDTLEDIETVFKDKTVWKQEKLELFKKIEGFTWCFDEEEC